MTIDLTSLIINTTTQINIDQNFEISQELINPTIIRNLNNLHIQAQITKNYAEEYNIIGTLKGNMILPDDLTLEDVSIPFDININENFTENEENNENNLRIIRNRLDILPFLWQNIVVEIPLKITSEKSRNIKLEGNGWRLITDEEPKKSDNMPFSDLQELIDARKE